MLHVMCDLMRLKQGWNLTLTYIFDLIIGEMGIEEEGSLAKKIYHDEKKRCGKKVTQDKGTYS